MLKINAKNIAIEECENYAPMVDFQNGEKFFIICSRLAEAKYIFESFIDSFASKEIDRLSIRTSQYRIARGSAEANFVTLAYGNERYLGLRGYSFYLTNGAFIGISNEDLSSTLIIAQQIA